MNQKKTEFYDASRKHILRNLEKIIIPQSTYVLGEKSVSHANHVCYMGIGVIMRGFSRSSPDTYGIEW